MATPEKQSLHEAILHLPARVSGDAAFVPGSCLASEGGVENESPFWGTALVQGSGDLSPGTRSDTSTGRRPRQRPVKAREPWSAITITGLDFWYLLLPREIAGSRLRARRAQNTAVVEREGMLTGWQAVLAMSRLGRGPPGQTWHNKNTKMMGT